MSQAKPPPQDEETDTTDAAQEETSGEGAQTDEASGKESPQEKVPEKEAKKAKAKKAKARGKAKKEVIEPELVDIKIPWLKDHERADVEAALEAEVEEIPKEIPPVLAKADGPPSTLFAFPMQELALFPSMVAPVILPMAALQELQSKIEYQQQFIALFARRNEAPEEWDDLYQTGVVARVLRIMQMPNGLLSAVVQVLQRCRIESILRKQPFIQVRVSLLEEYIAPGDHPTVEALSRNLRQLLADVAQNFSKLPQEFLEMLKQLEEPGRLADFVALQFVAKTKDRQVFLEELNLCKRLEQALASLLKESEMLKLQHQLREEIESQVEDRQREYLLREQLKLIRKELGEEADEKELDAEQYQERIAKAKMPEEVEKRARQELRRLSVLPPEASEYNIIRTYLDWLCDLPWSVKSKGNINIHKARKILDRDHHGLERVKERILEFLAVHKLKPDQRGAILCLSGPPGVGKTSLGHSIAHAMGREFFRFSVGGMRDEAEIKGHRRTYIGAMPGKLIQAMKRVGTRNPVIMLDEIDKIGKDHRGDPASALLEALDPAQNNGFLDHYLDVPFDLSEVMFITTANYRDAIPPPLLDRMEVIELSGYIPEEKVEIAKRYLLPRQREAHGLQTEQLRVSQAALRRVVNEYTREAGVRNLERQIGSICRKVATRIAEADDAEASEIRARIGVQNIEKYLGPTHFSRERAGARPTRPGRAVGLAWTPVGGDTLAIEVTGFPGSGRLELTGKLGDVMNESSRIALSYLKTNADAFGLDLDKLKQTDLHLHVPAGAVPKDGPSAGITITTAFLSLLAKDGKYAVKQGLAMTGEITLMGDVLAVGGIREKVVAAAAAAIDTIILPEQNRKDLQEVPDYIQNKLTFHFASHYSEIIPIAFGKDFLSR